MHIIILFVPALIILLRILAVNLNIKHIKNQGTLNESLISFKKDSLLKLFLFVYLFILQALFLVYVDFIRINFSFNDILLFFIIQGVLFIIIKAFVYLLRNKETFGLFITKICNTSIKLSVFVVLFIILHN